MYALRNCEPMESFMNRSYVTRYESFSDCTSSRIKNKLKRMQLKRMQLICRKIKIQTVTLVKSRMDKSCCNVTSYDLIKNRSNTP
jgi:hypothetical protein